jgi:hypothetical protein
LFGVNRQVYNRRIQSVKRRKSRAVQVIDLVESIRVQMPKIGTRKLYFMLEEQLKAIKADYDKGMHVPMNETRYNLEG